jgi:hypothetical protein
VVVKPSSPGSATQLHASCELLQRYEGIEPEEILPEALPDTPVTFEPNKEYAREILATQIDLAADGLDYVPASELPGEHRSRRYREIVNAGDVPSEMVIDRNRRQNGHEFATKPKDHTRSPNCAHRNDAVTSQDPRVPTPPGRRPPRRPVGATGL